MPSLYDAVSVAYNKLVGWLGLLPGILVAVIAITTVSDVLLRNFGLVGIAGSIEITQYCLLVLTVGGAANAMRARRHITVDILPEILPPQLSRLVSLIAYGLGTIFCLVFLIISIVKVVHGAQEGGDTQGTFIMPQWWVWTLIPACFFFMTIELILAFKLVLDNKIPILTGGGGRDGGL